MFILRALFWFALVSVMMPQGPDLARDLPADLHRAGIEYRALDRLRWDLTQQTSARNAPPLADFRNAVLTRLAQVRRELDTPKLRD